MIDFSRDYYKEYYKKISNLKDVILQESFSPQKSMKISWNIDQDDGIVLYSFKKLDVNGARIPLEEYNNRIIDDIVSSDDRILSFSKITIPSGQHVGEHVDNCYWSREFFRAHIPLMDTEAMFYYGEEEINWKMGQLYFFDVRNVRHSAKNDSDKDFEFIAIDICIENG